MTDIRGRSAYHHGDLREALLRAADEVLRERGLQGFTLRECARRAGVSHAAPKHHFGNVRGLLTELAARGFMALTETLRAHLAAAGDDLGAQFVATSRSYATFAAEHPEHFRIMFRSDLLDTSADVLAAAAHVTFTELTNVIRRQRGEREIGPEELLEHVTAERLLADILIGWCHIHGYAHLRLEGQLAMLPAEVEARAVDEAGRRLSALLAAGRR